ncbi:hypothetical protein ACA910_011379 [Epithemia clementina (nom. ined.)]
MTKPSGRFPKVSSLIAVAVLIALSGLVYYQFSTFLQELNGSSDEAKAYRFFSYEEERREVHKDNKSSNNHESAGTECWDSLVGYWQGSPKELLEMKGYWSGYLEDHKNDDNNKTTKLRCQLVFGVFYWIKNPMSSWCWTVNIAMLFSMGNLRQTMTVKQPLRAQFITTTLTRLLL